MTFLLIRRSILGAAAAWALALPVQASCGTAVCPIDTRSSYPIEARSVRVGYEFDYIDQDQPRIGTDQASVGEIHGHHDEVRTISRTHRFWATAGLTDRFALDLSLPVISRSHRHIHNHHGQAIAEGWDFTGVGDLLAQVRYAVIRPKEQTWGLYLNGGVEFPTGMSEVDNDQGEHAEAALTPGSASYDAVAGASTLRHFSVPLVTGEYGLMPFFASLHYKWNGKGHDDYLIGNILTTSAGVTYPLLTRWGFIAQVNFVSRAEDGAGTTHEEVEKTGGDYLYVSPGLQWRPMDHLEVYSIVQLPVYQRVNEIQLTSDWNLLAGLSYRFRLGG